MIYCTVMTNSEIFAVEAFKNHKWTGHANPFTLVFQGTQFTSPNCCQDIIRHDVGHALDLKLRIFGHSNLYGFRHSRVLPSPSFVLVSVFMGKFAAMIKVAFNFRVVSWITQRICYINSGVPRICQRANQNDPFGTESSMDFMDSSCRPHLRSGLSSLSPLWLYTMFKHSQTWYN